MNPEDIRRMVAGWQAVEELKREERRKAEAKPRRPGRLKGRIRIDPDLEEPLPEEILAAFRGERD